MVLGIRKPGIEGDRPPELRNRGVGRSALTEDEAEAIVRAGHRVVPRQRLTIGSLRAAKVALLLEQGAEDVVGRRGSGIARQHTIDNPSGLVQLIGSDQPFGARQRG